MLKHVRTTFGDPVNVSTALFNAITERAKEDPRVVFVASDSGTSYFAHSDPANLQWLLSTAPYRFVECGIAEANAGLISAGLAAQGLIPFWWQHPYFLERAYNHLRQSICTDRRNVTVFGCGGLGGGPSHQTIMDIAAIGAIPNILIVAPADAVEGRKAIDAAYKYQGPMYIKYPRTAPTLFEDDYPFQLGRSTLVREGDDATIVGLCEWVYDGWLAAERLAQDGIEARVVDMSAIKPMDREIVVRAARETGAIVTAEMSNTCFGMGSEVAAIVGETYPVPLQRVALPDAFTSAPVRSMEELRAAYHVSIDDLVTAVKATLARKQ